MLEFYAILAEIEKRGAYLTPIMLLVQCVLYALFGPIALITFAVSRMRRAWKRHKGDAV